MSQQLGHGRSRILYLIVTFALILSFCTPLFELPRALAQAPAPEREQAPDARQTVAPALTLLPTIPIPTPTVEPTAEPTVTPEPPAPEPEPPAPDIPAEPLPALPVTLRVEAQPRSAWPGETVTLAFWLEAREPTPALTVRLPLPQGLDFEGFAGHEGRYVAEERAVYWDVADLFTGAVFEWRLVVVVRDDALDLMTARCELAAEGYASRSSAPILVKRLFGPTTASVSAETGGELVSADGRVRVIFPPGAVTQTLRIEHTPLRVDPADGVEGEPFLQFDLKAITDSPVAEPTAVDRFAQPLTLSVSYAGLFDWDDLPYYRYAALVYYDEREGRWVELPSDREGEALVAALDHFTTFGIDFTNIEDYGWVPTANNGYVSTFDGAFKYDYPIAVPEGRGGLTPDVSLNYNSRRVDGILTGIQADWVGLGWTVDSMEIVREIRPSFSGDNTWDDGEIFWANKFTLVYKGSTYKLKTGYEGDLDDSKPYGRYYCEDESFIYIERRNDAGAAYGYGGSPANYTGEYWVVRTADGTAYRLGYNEDSEQALATSEYEVGENCQRDGHTHGPYSELCYAGRTTNLVAYRWRVDTITDTLGNRMLFDYVESRCNVYTDSTHFDINWRESASYLNQIRYNFTSSDDGSYRSKVVFVRAARSSDGGCTDTHGCGSYFWFQNDYLSSIQTWNWDGNDLALVREYKLEYIKQEPPKAGDGTEGACIRMLSTITEYGTGGISQNHALPATTLGYSWYPNKGTRSGTWYSKAFTHTRLVTVTTPYDGRVAVTYEKPEPDTCTDEAWNYRVATKTTVATDAQGGGSVVEYDYPDNDDEWEYRGYDSNDIYGCEAYDQDINGGNLVGYRMVTETLKTLGGATVSSTRHDFYVKMEADPEADRRLMGREWLTTYKDESDVTQKLITTTWAVTIPRSVSPTLFLTDTYFVYAAIVSDAMRTVQPGYPMTLTKVTEYRYDPYYQGGHLRGSQYSAQLGNLTHTIERDPAAGEARVTRNVYYPNTSAWIIGQVANQTVFSGEVADLCHIVANTETFYDGNGGMALSPSRGLPTLMRHLKNLDCNDPPAYDIAWVTEAVEYDSSRYYIPISQTDAVGSVTYVQYGNQPWVRPTSITKAYGTPLALTTSYTYGASGTITRAMGLVTSVTDANNQATTYAYDYFGRLTRVVRPGDSDSQPTLAYAYFDAELPLRISASQLITTGKAVTTYDYYNGLGQLIERKQAASDQSNMIVTHHTYNAQGLKEYEYTPYITTTYSTAFTAIGSYSDRTSYTYDALGRNLTTTGPDATTTTMAYDGLRKGVIDANSHVTVYVSDALGRVASIEEGIGEGAGWSVYATTYYAYNPLDLLTTVTNTEGITTGMTYDLLGRKTAMSDPDMGQWSYTYDDAGNLISQTDARGRKTCFYYDALGRLTGKAYDCFGACPAEPRETIYTYDQGALGKGYRTAISTTLGITATGAPLTATWRYDARGRVISENLGITGEVYGRRWGYTIADQVERQVYPSGTSGALGETVITGYDVYGRPSQLSSATYGGSYVSSAQYDALNRLDWIGYGNNDRTDYVYYPFTQKGGRLHYLWTGTPTSTTYYQDLAYDYDAVGNVKYITDGKNNGQVQSFAYDERDRLIAAGTTLASSGQYSKTYAYDTVGNLTSTTQVTTSQTTAYTYTGAGEHKLTYCGPSRYWHDANGNVMLVRQNQGAGQGPRRAYAYDAENRMICASQTITGQQGWINNYGVDAGGWTSCISYPRTIGDVTGDGKADVVGFGQNAAYASASTGSSFAPTTVWSGNFDVAGGWISQDLYPRMLGDVTGDGKADVVGFGMYGASVGVSSGVSFTSPSLWISNYGTNAGGWTNYTTYPRAVGDVNGDGKADIVAFGQNYTFVSLSTGVSFTAAAGWSSTFDVQGGWTSQSLYPRLLGDVNGDGKADVVGCKDAGVVVGLSTGSSFTAPVTWTTEFCYNVGWTSFDTYPRALADMNGDGMDDLVGFKGSGTWVALSTGRSFAPATLWYDHYSGDAGGWGSYNINPRALGNVDGVCGADIVGFGNLATYVTRYDHQARMYYDADGNRVVSLNDGVRAVYIGDWVETGAAYYHLGGQRAARRAAGGVTYLHGDHLGSTAKTTGAASSAQLYEAYGAKRGSTEVDTPYRYTGQRWEENDALDIYYYKARWYDPALGRFLQPDSVVPEPANPQTLNRYAYGLNNPVKYTDPTGHWIDLGDGFGVRQNENGWYTILYGGSEFRNYVEIALANIIMNGGSLESYDLPVASGPASERTLAAVGVELGYEAANPLIDQLLDPNLFAGVACLAGDFVDDGVGAALQGANRTKGFVPNPNGKKGGAAHQAGVQWVEDDVTSRGFKAKKEFPVRIEKPDGTKTYRYIDVAAIDKQSNKPVEFHQVGRLTAGGQPVSRERRVFNELSVYGGDYSDVPTWFHGYQP